MKKLLMVMLILISFFMIPSLFASSIEKQPLTNADVIRMVKEGINEDVIIAFIESNKTNFDVSLEAIVQLKKARVKPNIITAMIRAEKKERSDILKGPSKITVNGLSVENITSKIDQSGLRYLVGKVIIGQRRVRSITVTVDLVDELNNIIRTEQDSWTADSPYSYISNHWDFKVVASYEGISQYIIRDVVIIDFHSNNVVMVDKGKEKWLQKSPYTRAIKTDFFINVIYYYMLSGRNSTFRINNNSPVFELYLPTVMQASAYTLLVKLNVQRNYRQIDTADMVNPFIFSKANVVHVSIVPVGEPYGRYQLYRMKPVNPLGTGEYAILVLTKRGLFFFDFGIGIP